MNVKQMWLIGAVALVGGSVIESAHAMGKSEVEAYVKIQEALAKDSLEEAKSAALVLAKAKAAKDVKSGAAAVAKAKSIEDARNAFKRLSGPVVKAVAAGEVEGFDRYTCPMAKAEWVQKAGETANPYYGQSMATCGEKLK